MKVLIVTQAVDADSSTLGFFVEWLREFSKQCERVDVIALSVGRHDLPANVRVVSMGKERGFSRPRRLLEYWRHLRIFLADADGVFIHMCPEYLLAGWPLFAASRKPVVFWYAHRSKNLMVRAAARLATFVATSVPGAFTIAGAKTRPLGQGVPTGMFAALPEAYAPPYRFAAVGRLTPIKRLELLIEALAILRYRNIDAILELWGEAALESDRAYEAALREKAAALGLSDRVIFVGAVQFSDMPRRYAGIAAALNACPKGAVDKAVLEAMSCARPAVVTNENFSEVFGSDAPLCMAAADPEDIAGKMRYFCENDRAEIGKRLRVTVVARHGLPHLVKGALELMRTNPA